LDLKKPGQGMSGAPPELSNMSIRSPGKAVTITINKNQYRAMEGEILLSVAIREKIDIPHLCYEGAFDPYGACRLCIVDVVTCGKTDMTTACTLRAEEGLEILTDMPDIIRHRNVLLERYLEETPNSDTIREMAAKYGVTWTTVPEEDQRW
jgi:bidirectional [NiFe] hydrogenase diaphorase subunit